MLFHSPAAPFFLVAAEFHILLLYFPTKFLCQIICFFLAFCLLFGFRRRKFCCLITLLACCCRLLLAFSCELLLYCARALAGNKRARSWRWTKQETTASAGGKISATSFDKVWIFFFILPHCFYIVFSTNNKSQRRERNKMEPL